MTEEDELALKRANEQLARKKELEYLERFSKISIGGDTSAEGIAAVLMARQYVKEGQLPPDAIATCHENFKVEIGVPPPHWQIEEMHKKFGIEFNGKKPKKLTKTECEFRHDALQEEATELFDAETIEDQADALIDSIIFALGGLEKMGLINKFEDLFSEVMRANMSKELANDASKSKRGFKLDLIKPEGWKPANLKPIINS